MTTADGSSPASVNHQGRRRYFLRTEVFDLLRPFAPSVAVELDGLRYYVDTNDFGLSRIVFAQGSYDQDVMAEAFAIIKALSGQSRLLEGRTFVDIGANIGTSTIPAIKVFGAAEGIAFEPEPQNYRLLRCNLLANDLDDRVQAHRLGLSDRTGWAALELAPNDSGDHRVRLRNDLADGPYHESSRPAQDIVLARLDDVVADHAIDVGRIGVVWMDTQGHEGQVLAGATILLDGDIPVVLEYWPYGLRRADGLGLLSRLVAEHYRRVVDVRASMKARRVVEFPATQLQRLEEVYVGRAYTDLVLLK